MQEALDKSLSDPAGLCRYTLKDEHLLHSSNIKAEITRAFEENRAFSFFPAADLVSDMRTTPDIDRFRSRCIDIKNNVFIDMAKDDFSLRGNLEKDTRLSERITNAIRIMHLALAEGDYTSLHDRRIVIIKELPGKPTIYHISNETTLITHIGQGPFWQELPTLYLGLKTFDILDDESRRGGRELFDTFLHILKVEERAIETGFHHLETQSADFAIALNSFVDALISYTGQTELRATEPVEKKESKPFQKKMRDKFLEMLDTRIYQNDFNLDYNENVKAIDSLARLAKRYKTSGDRSSLREIIRLLVSASGHDIHEIRNRANIILERVLSLKEYEAPLALTFINIHVGESFAFSFDLPEGDYFLRIYHNRTLEHIFVNDDIEFDDYPLEYDEQTRRYRGKVLFNEYGHCDFVVHRKRQKRAEWVSVYGASGRVNVMPDLRGELVLQVFTDIHGHTKMWWMDEEGHQGLVYNENGEVIRTGRFSDLTAHLGDLKSRYYITAIYLLGMQKRGSHREDWAAGATSPSPFSPMSLIDVDENLGGEEEFKQLVEEAHRHEIRIIVDCIPHINRHSDHLSDENVVFCYGSDGRLVARSATDGRYGSWDDGKLLNYRRFEVWEWMKDSVSTLIEKFDIDGIRFDSAHAVPIMMKKNNFRFVYDRERSHEEMVEGRIIVNDRWDDHFITTGYYDCQCRDSLAIPFHHYLMTGIQKAMRKHNKKFFIHIAECFWGHERFLSRSGIIPYNSSLFKVCENISHGKSDVREIYHIYDNYYPSVLSRGTELLGILGNHDERRAINTFGERGLRAAITLTSFISNIIMDYEGSAEGEGWKVFLDNIYVNWNRFEYASHRSVERFYREIYSFHRQNRGKGYLIWANNNMVAAAMKFTANNIWIGSFNFADSNQTASLQFDNPVLPIEDDAFYKVVDPVYSKITGTHSYFTGRELKVSRINTIVSYVDRVKLLCLEKVESIDDSFCDFFKDSFYRLCGISVSEKFLSNFAFLQMAALVKDPHALEKLLKEKIIPLFEGASSQKMLELGLKRSFYHFYKSNIADARSVIKLIDKLTESKDSEISRITETIKEQHSRGPIIFMSAEADPFSKSGGLANVVYELPRELVRHGEEVYVITGFYRNGDDKAIRKMNEACKKYGVKYSGINVHFYIMGTYYEVGVHIANVEGVNYYLLDHHELFDGLYWGFTAQEKLRRRIGFARACAEVICSFNLHPYFTFTNDAYAGVFNGVVRSDSSYSANEYFKNNTYLHIVHNGGWQYFDAYHRYENGFDLFSLFNLDGWKAGSFLDPVHGERINCMATGIRFADRVITVSPSYARQIEYQSDGLENILSNVLGISNGVGNDLFNRMKTKFDASGFVTRNWEGCINEVRKTPAMCAKVMEKYPEILDGPDAVEAIKGEKRRYIARRAMYKMLLQYERNLLIDPDIVMFVMIHRITEQKGYQLLLDASEGIFRTLGCQGIMGGSVSSGDESGEKIAHGLWLLSQYYPKSANVAIGFQEVAVPLMACDLFLMPSMNEPGGISQLEAFLCGSLLVARATGGLRDTVFPIRPGSDATSIEGNGFLFSDFSSHSFYDALARAVDFFKKSSDDEIYTARMNAVNSVFYWDKAAKEYIRNIYDMKEIIRPVDDIKVSKKG